MRVKTVFDRAAALTYIEGAYEPDSNGCWRWQLRKDSHGYGTCSKVMDGRKYQRAHRLAYEVLKGGLRDDLVIDHLCRVRDCINPDHLEQVTARVNTQRGANSLKDKCPKGHPYSGDNLFEYEHPTAGKWRFCQTCRREGLKKLNDFKVERRRRMKEAQLRNQQGDV